MNNNNNKDFTPRCLSLDLEVSVETNVIHQLAAVRGDTNIAYVKGKDSLDTALTNLDEFGKDLSFLLGHNIIEFDIPHLRAAKPNLGLLNLPAVDTLRINPLAFPKNPYHKLVKHYKDGQLRQSKLNDPELDARLTLEVFHNQRDEFVERNNTQPELIKAWHWLTTMDGSFSGVNAFFTTIRKQARPIDDDAKKTILKYLSGCTCKYAAIEVLKKANEIGWEIAYAMAWLSVSGGNSVVPPWVRYQFPVTMKLIKSLRDTPCHNEDCNWCSERHNSKKELNRFFGFDEYRNEPVDEKGSLQQQIVEAGMQGHHVLGIMPTGAGKSLCYQIPALSRYDKTGSLTIVISPLVALMADQVNGLEAKGITNCAALNGLLSMPERSDVLDRVRLGDIGILIVSPEQLRNQTFRKVIAQREIGAWVIDEAHCLSKWGHDFRPDYRYVGRFIKESSIEIDIPPIMCLTATAKPDVIADIENHFKDKLGITFRLFNGGANRNNLEFSVIPTSTNEKYAHIASILESELPDNKQGGAIIYCATRKQTKEISDFLKAKGTNAEAFHAKLPPETKKSIQQNFINGQIQIIVATNAFGMGIDKPDVRLVIHADIPGSLENYLQEAGRAGRDRKFAKCILLYLKDDIERQFGMSASSRLNRQEIQAILRSLRRLDKKKRTDEIVATSGEILFEDNEGEFERDTATDDTRVRTALLWLEESALLSREENFVQIFPSSLRITTLKEAKNKIVNNTDNVNYQNQLIKLVSSILDTPADQGISTDELTSAAGLSTEKLRKAMHDLEKLGICSNDMALTAYLHVGIKNSSKNRYEETSLLESAFISKLRETGADVSTGENSLLHLRQATQDLKNEGFINALPEKLWLLIKSLSRDGQDEEGGLGSLGVRRVNKDTASITPNRNWGSIEKTAQFRRDAAACILEHLMTSIPSGSKGTDILAETTYGKLQQALENDIALKNQINNYQKLLDCSLLWLHEQECIRLNKGLAVFRPAMTIKLNQDRRNFNKTDYEPLKHHYEQQTIQIHIMDRYAELATDKISEAINLIADYFNLNQDEFIKRWLSAKEKELSLQTTPESWQKIVESLNNPNQQRIVSDNREQTNVLVLAGPGSGKTRVLVHRIAYLIRVRREIPKGILALTYNRHAAVEIRKRLYNLIGNDMRDITIMTCHAMAMRLVGSSYMELAKNDNDAYKEVLIQATQLLNNDELTTDEANEQRERLLAGFRWILVDEYQDIDKEQYELISAIAGRTLDENEGKLTLFAVGDDDQNIYSFNGASVEFIRRFEQDYKTKPSFLTENYRSTKNIIESSNVVIDSANSRLKSENPITIDRKRNNHPKGERWESIDTVSRGRVQIIHGGKNQYDQAIAAMTELIRLSTLDKDWNWSNVAIISREKKYLDPARSFCELNDIPTQLAADSSLPFWKLRETQSLLDWISTIENPLLTSIQIKKWVSEKNSNLWWELILQAIDEFELESSTQELPKSSFIEWLAEWGREIRRRQNGLLLTSAHRAKGLEFDHVIILDGGWEKKSDNEDIDASRRLFYVAMTRASQTLTIIHMNNLNPFIKELKSIPTVIERKIIQKSVSDDAIKRRYHTLSQKEIDIGFAGRFEPNDPIHHNIKQLNPGDELFLQQDGAILKLCDSSNNVISKLAKSFRLPKDEKLLKAYVVAVIKRTTESVPQEYIKLYKSKEWEVVVPEFIFSK